MSPLRTLILQRRRVAEFECLVRGLGDAFRSLYTLPDNRRTGQAIVMNLEVAHATAQALDEAIQALNAQREAVRAAAKIAGGGGSKMDTGR